MKIINNNNNNNNKGDSDYYYFCAMIKKVAVPILVACFFVVAAQAEVLVIKAPLTWGLDKSAEYPLPKVLNGIYTTDQFVATEGQVSAITMNWESRGAISMEVSADNGLHYTPVINGVPLESGFVSGDRIRWRAQALNEDAQLTAVNLSYSDTSGVIGDFGQPLLSGFMYRKEFIVRNDSREDLYNYQMKLRIGESELAKDADICLSKKAKEDFSDIRISASDGKRILSYYLESIEGELPGKRSAVIWVNIPQLPKEKDLKLYLYYGNPQALSLSSGEQTFDFFDDFKDPAKSNEKWITYTEKNGTLQLKNGEIKLDAAEAITKDFLFKEGIVEYPVEIESGFENSLNLRVQNGNSYDIPLWSGYSSLYKGAEHCIAVEGTVRNNDTTALPSFAGNRYYYRFEYFNGNIVFSRFDALTKEKQAEAVFKSDSLQKIGYLSLRSGGDGNGKNVIRFGAILVRKAALIKPYFVSAGKEEQLSLPIFSGTTLSSFGSLTLAKGAMSGHYISSNIRSEDQIRIMIPDWDIDSLGGEFILHLSADAGGSYKKGCEKGKYYYASKKDFVPGKNLKIRIDLLKGAGSEVEKVAVPFVKVEHRAGKVNIISPNGREVWEVGSSKKISWSALDYDETYLFDLAYSVNGGKDYIEIIANKDNDGVYTWVVPDKITKIAKIKISDSLDKGIYDLSDAYFSIVAREDLSIQEEKKEEAGVVVQAALKDKASKESKDKKDKVTKESKKKKDKVSKENKKLPGKNLYDLLIKIGDSRSSYSEGDIVILRPSGYIWSVEEREKFLIAQVYLTEKQAEELTSPLKTKDGEILSRRKYRINLLKQGLKGLTGSIKRPKGSFEAGVIEDKAN